MNKLTTNLVTHRLTVEMNGEKKSFLLSQPEAKQIQSSINNKSLQFLDIGDEFYPKFGATLIRLSKEMIDSMASTFHDYTQEFIRATEVIEKVSRTIFIRKKIRAFSNGKEEVLKTMRGYYENGNFNILK